MDDGLLEDACFRWRSSKDGDLGVGRHVICTLTPGAHVIEVQAVTPQGAVSRAETRVSSDR